MKLAPVRDLAAAAALSLVPGMALAGPPTAPPPPSPIDAPITYVVQRGDTLYDLAKAYLRSVNDYRHVQRVNRISQPRALPIGARLRIDPALLRTDPLDARLSAFSGRVQVETGGRLAPARVGMAILEGQRLITGPNAFATIDIADASRVTLPSNTSLRVVRLRQVVLTSAPQRIFQLDEGRGTVSATPTTNPNARFEVRTPVSISAVRGTEFRVRYAPAQPGLLARAQTEVLKGAVAVYAPDASSVVLNTATATPAGFGVTATADAVSGPTALLPPPRLAAGDDRQSERIVRFAAEPVAGAAAYRMQLSRDAGFVDLFAEATAPEPVAVFDDMPGGTYFIRLTALDGGGLEGLGADYSFDRDLDTLEPGPSPTPSVEGKHRYFLFRWNAAGDGVRSFRFQLFSGTEPVSPIVDQPGLTDPQLTLTDLPPGAYSWRVSAVRFKKGTYTERLGPLQPLQIGR
ncbi:peptigoglycan-binding protein LysM [Caulobacter sp. Root655]|uniref:FecR domain-containing protein n=1 Tax=Caulobacter sp. Root655 TaxID=1736578 RepID=UPI0006F5D569|nr:FecR domain-containing protein [Caulobacter sp. Root655]KRA59576.1 peptigoglycan-binding protein LysM [Caulobacter sp. Root655]